MARLSCRSALTVCALAAGLLASAPAVHADDARPLHAIYITGGCCHDYNRQKEIIPRGVTARANVRWSIVQEGGNTTNHRVSLYEQSGWADKYDLIVHNECFSGVHDPELIERVIAPTRKGKPTVVIHCAMHTFSSHPTDEYREFLGVTTRRHGPQQPLEVKNLKPDDPIMAAFPPVWKTGNEELYAIEKVWPGTVSLAQAYALDNKRDHTVIWRHTYGAGRLFGTTIAHHNATMEDPIYLDMLTRGLLWACDRLDTEGNPKPGYGPAAAARD
jgi:type 1 glutamine amidotransferase